MENKKSYTNIQILKSKSKIVVNNQILEQDSPVSYTHLRSQKSFVSNKKKVFRVKIQKEDYEKDRKPRTLSKY